MNVEESFTSIKAIATSVITVAGVLIGDLINLIPDNLANVGALLGIVLIVWQIRLIKLRVKITELELKNKQKSSEG